MIQVKISKEMIYIFIIVVIFALLYIELYLDKNENKSHVICYVIDLIIRLSKYSYVLLTFLKNKK